MKLSLDTKKSSPDIPYYWATCTTGTQSKTRFFFFFFFFLSTGEMAKIAQSVWRHASWQLEQSKAAML